jgi:hypothetical protein
MSWEQLAVENYRAARTLFAAGYHRACIGRCYYAAYCAVAARLADKGITTFTRGAEIWHNPPHERIPNYVRNDLGLASGQSAAISVELLRLIRVDADYKPGCTIDVVLASDTLREAGFALSLLRVVI